jgi:hypothetical protein
MIIAFLESKLYLFIAGTFIICLYIYFRLFRSLDHYSLDTLRDHISPKILLLSISFILLHLLVIGSILYFLYKQYYNIQRTSWLIVYTSRIVDYVYWKPLEYLHDIIAPDLPYSGILIAHITEYLEKGNQKLRYKVYRHGYLLFDYLPRLLVSSIFFIDIVILNQIHYFLYCIWLLLIPIIYKIYLKLCTSFVVRNEPDLLEILDINTKTNPDENGIYIEVFSMKAKYVSDALVLEETVNNYITLRRITRHVAAIKENFGKYDLYIIVFTSSLYLSAAIYRLLYILL